MAQDDVLVAAEKEAEAAALNGKPPQKKRYRPPALGWDNYRSDMADIKELLQHVIAASAQSERSPEPLARPEFAIDRWDKQWRADNTAHMNKLLGITN